MSLGIQLEKLERFTAKVWRKYSKEDPIAQLSFNEYDYLKVIQGAQEAIRLTDLAAELEVTKPSASNMVKRLERKGLVRRTRCSEDARSHRFELTELAEEHLESEAKVYQILANRVSQHLSDEESAVLGMLLNKALR
ncbi:MarR family transcriptional regulator [Vibrio fluvialis]|nr:MarR family transcriptional regulator [Vibrio fluvialis]MBY7983901.1 MarR family transcriptional regulator [Vibrio fluvialis]